MTDLDSVPVPPPSPLALMTEDEVQLAHRIRHAAATTTAGLSSSSSDFEIAQLAVTCLANGEAEDMDAILTRLFQLQCFRQEYRIQDTIEDATEIWRIFMTEQQPQHILEIDIVKPSLNFIFMFDNRAFNPKAVDLPKDWRTFLGAYYYMAQCMCKDLRSIREGIVVVIECEGMGVDNWDPHVLERWTNELISFYPTNFKEILLVNTPLAANIVCSLMKPWITKGMFSKFRLGHRLESFEGRLDELMLLPTPDIARVRLMERMKDFLRERLHNERTFTLPPLQQQPTNNLILDITNDAGIIHSNNNGMAEEDMAVG
jgi:hypothetical protein